MQDPSAGVELQEVQRGRHIDKCFNGTLKYLEFHLSFIKPGKDAIDWLVSWCFASTKEEAIQLANSMLRNGFFHAIEEGSGKFARSMIAADKGKCYDFQDLEYARYIFVSH